MIDDIQDFTKPDIEDQWNQACQLEDGMIAENLYSSICACCGHRCRHNIIQLGLTHTIDPYILEPLISSES